MKINFNLNISNRTFYLIATILTVIIVASIAFAATYSQDAPNPGHSKDELAKCPEPGQMLIMRDGEWICFTCAEGQVLKGNGSGLICMDD